MICSLAGFLTSLHGLLVLLHGLLSTQQEQAGWLLRRSACYAALTCAVTLHGLGGDSFATAAAGEVLPVVR
jgi:hypothetical protein